MPKNRTAYLSLQSGWNMVGNPFDADLPWSNVGVTVGGPVRDFGYIYDRGSNSYILVSDVPGVSGTNAIPAKSAMWMRSTGAYSVAVGAVSSTASARQEKWVRSAGEFVLPIVARAGKAADTAARAGVVTYARTNPDLYNIENPPALGQFVDVFFTSQDGRLLTCDIRGEAEGTLTYDFAVNTSLKRTMVALSLPDLSQVPRDKSVILIDTVTGKRMWARTMNTYTYNSGEGGVRQFQLQIAPNNGGGLAVTVASAEVRGAGAAVTYTLSKPATVQATVMNLSGRAIRVLSQGSVATAGVNSLSWDLRNSSGTRVPPGRYLVNIKALSDDGQQVSALAPLQVK